MPLPDLRLIIRRVVVLGGFLFVGLLVAGRVGLRFFGLVGLLTFLGLLLLRPGFAFVRLRFLPPGLIFLRRLRPGCSGSFSFSLLRL